MESSARKGYGQAHGRSVREVHRCPRRIYGEAHVHRIHKHDRTQLWVVATVLPRRIRHPWKGMGADARRGHGTVQARRFSTRHAYQVREEQRLLAQRSPSPRRHGNPLRPRPHDGNDDDGSQRGRYLDGCGERAEDTRSRESGLQGELGAGDALGPAALKR